MKSSGGTNEGQWVNAKTKKPTSSGAVSMVQLVLAFLICVFLGMHLNKSAVLTMPETVSEISLEEEIRANDVAKKEEAAAAVTEAKVAAEVLTTEPEINMPDVAEVVVEEVLNVAGEG